VHIAHELAGLDRAQGQERYGRLVQERLIAPTRALLGGERAPDVVLWPESSLWDRFYAHDVGTRRFPIVGTWPRSQTSLVLGASIYFDKEHEMPPTPAALRFELAGARLVDHQQKRVLVPGGEFPPLYAWLPRSVGDTLVAWFEAALDSLPRATPGKELPPLRPDGGVPFGALLCYDNAFPGPAAAQVAMGARWLCVLSNESWYEGGGELVQLTAMAVVRALETGTPIVRCTQDGWSCLVDARGHVVASLPIAPAPQPAARILRVEIAPGPGRLPPLAWLRSATGPAAGLALLALLLHALLRRARLLPVRTAVHAAADPGSSGNARGSGS
jgi:apolipoprotein N-acyltransferase